MTVSPPALPRSIPAASPWTSRRPHHEVGSSTTPLAAWSAARSETTLPTPAVENGDRFRIVAPDAVPDGALILGVLVITSSSQRQHLHDPGDEGGRSEAGTDLAAVVAGPGLLVDQAARSAFLDGTELDLTRREFDLLEHLTRYSGQVHSREQLMQAVWRFDDPRLSAQRTVDVHVARLRRKLGPAHGRRLETLRGIGYRWRRRPDLSGGQD